ncbi:MAG TPA: hydantoinase/oxoprolinase family protein [Syntrophomonadaceae bacterium]|nr:hydantoinase/oxoprolinase family protein [Syntrophomonadaceae bacterium]
MTWLLIGIDVGGTFTDGVLFNGRDIVKTIKRPTDNNNLQSVMLDVLDDLLEVVPDQKTVERIVLSTTLVTNLLATGQGKRTALILIPGYGLPHAAYHLSPDTFFLSGAIDFRGREIQPLSLNEIISLAEKLKKQGIKRAAVAGKFSNRNRSHEDQVAHILKKEYADLEVTLSCDISNRLNFPRRAATAYFTAMVSPEWQHFVDEVEKALQQKGLEAEVHILKADGGTLPLSSSRKYPCETIFSGPAASTMGALALTMDNQNSLVVDIGGTTSDLALLVEGLPLHASKGARLLGQYTHVDAVSVRSIAIGGDSPLAFVDGELRILSQRQGPAACFGGETATVTDAFNYRLSLNQGDIDRSREYLQKIADMAHLKLEDLCDRIINQVVTTLSEATREMFKEWENEPAYRVWEIVHRKHFTLDRVVGIGAAAYCIIPRVAETLEVQPFIHRYSDVANALGAAVARPTLSVYLHLDTERSLCAVEPGGIVEKRSDIGKYQLEDARQLAVNYLYEMGKVRGMDDYLEDYKVFLEEQFNMIRGWSRTGRLFDVGVQIAPGLIQAYQGVE